MSTEADGELGGAREFLDRAFHLVTRKVWPQQRLLDVRDFCAHAQKRGVSPIAPSDLQRLAKNGVLWPVVAVRAPTRQHRVVGHDARGCPIVEGRPCDGPDSAETVAKPQPFGTLSHILTQTLPSCERIDPTEADAATLRDPQTHMPVAWWYYHPYQVLYLAAAWQSTAIRVDAVDPATLSAPDTLISQLREHSEHMRRGLLKANAAALGRLCVLLAIEDMYLPHLGAPFHGDWDDYQLWRLGVEPETALKELSFTIDELRALRSGWARKGHCLDPNAHIVPVIRNMRRSVCDRLTGHARLALDYYEVADLLGRFLTDLTGERQPTLEELLCIRPSLSAVLGESGWSGPTKEGAWNSDAARLFGLDTNPRFYWYVEGDSEERFLRSCCEESGIDLESRGVRLCNMRGNNPNIDSFLLADVADAKRRKAAILFTVDEDTGFDRLVRYARQQSIRNEPLSIKDIEMGRFPCGVFVWNGCFEDANWTAEEWLGAWVETEDWSRLADTVEDGAGKARNEVTKYLADHPGAKPREAWAYVAKRLNVRDPSKARVAERLGGNLARERARNPEAPLPPVGRLLERVLRCAQDLARGEAEYPPQGSGECATGWYTI